MTDALQPFLGLALAGAIAGTVVVLFPGIFGFAVALFLFALGPAAGLAIWGYIKARYRNAGARYMPERVVDFKVTSLEKSDTYLRETKSSSSRMSGANEDDVHVRAQFVRVFQHGELEQPKESTESSADDSDTPQA